MTGSEGDRRHEPRVKALNLVHVEEYSYPALKDWKTDDAIGRTLDLSHDGMRLELDHCLPLRSRVRVDLALGNQLLRLEGRIRSLVEVNPTACDHGVEFLDVTKDQYQILEEYLSLRVPEGEGETS